MYPDSFEYHRAESVEHALELLADLSEVELLAGGHSLIPTMKTGLSSPAALVDIGQIDSLKGIDRREDSIRIGAMTTYATIAADETCWADLTAVAEAAQAVGDVQVRNRGTIGGNVAHADPASDLPGAVLSADADLVARGTDGERTIPADEFFLGMYGTALEEDEILTALEFPVDGQTGAGAYEKNPSPASGYAIVGVAVTLRTDDDRVETARVATNGVMDHAVRLESTEAALRGESLEGDRVETAADAAGTDLDQDMMMDDLQASSDFRAQLLRVHTREAIERAGDRLGTTVRP